MTSNLLALLTARLDTSLRTLTAATETVTRRREEISALLDRQVRRIEVVAEQATQREVADVYTQSLEMAQRIDFRSMTHREARAASRMFNVLSRRQLEALFAERPVTWRTFTEEFFRKWDLVSTVSSRPHLADLIRRAPKGEIPFLGGVDTSILVDPAGPKLVASRFHFGNTLREIATTIVETMKFKLRWDFSLHLLAHAACHLNPNGGLGALWDSLGHAPDIAELLFPRPHDNSSNGFVGSTAAKGVFVGELLRRAATAPTASVDTLSSALVRSDFGDPRVPPLSSGWIATRAEAPAAYAAFVEQLVREDLALFFEHAMREPDRKTFWLRYLPSIRRTLCVLARDDYERLSKTLGGSDAKLHAALERVRRFKTSAGASAFCLYFDSHVIVEFSESGNAAYIYEHARFDEAFERKLAKNAINSPQDLKQNNSSRIVHRGAWEDAAQRQLAMLGIARTRGY